MFQWGQIEIKDEKLKKSFFDILGQDIEIIKNVLLLTGALHGTKNLVYEYLKTFESMTGFGRMIRRRHIENLCEKIRLSAHLRRSSKISWLLRKKSKPSKLQSLYWCTDVGNDQLEDTASQ